MDRWEIALCELWCPPPKVGTQKPHAVFYDTNPLIYWDFIAPRFLSHSKFRCLKDIYSPYGLLKWSRTHHCLLQRIFWKLVLGSGGKAKFRGITILIIDTAGKLIAFPNSKTLAKVVLHFRRVLQSLYINTLPPSSAFITDYGSTCTVLTTSSGARLRW